MKSIPTMIVSLVVVSFGLVLLGSIPIGVVAKRVVDYPEVSIRGGGLIDRRSDYFPASDQPARPLLLQVEAKENNFEEPYWLLKNNSYAQCYENDAVGQGKSCNSCWAFAVKNMIQARTCKDRIDADLGWGDSEKVSPLNLICQLQEGEFCASRGIFQSLHAASSLGIVKKDWLKKKLGELNVTSLVEREKRWRERQIERNEQEISIIQEALDAAEKNGSSISEDKMATSMKKLSEFDYMGSKIDSPRELLMVLGYFLDRRPRERGSLVEVLASLGVRFLQRHLERHQDRWTSRLKWIEESWSVWKRASDNPEAVIDVSEPSRDFCSTIFPYSRRMEVLENERLLLKNKKIDKAEPFEIQEKLRDGPVIGVIRLTWEFQKFNGSLFDPTENMTFCRPYVNGDFDDYCSPDKMSPSDLLQQNETNRGNWYNHFVTIHGWGVKTVPGQPNITYWVVENSWGRVYDNDPLLGNNGAGVNYDPMLMFQNDEKKKHLVNKNHFLLIADRIAGEGGLEMTTRTVYLSEKLKQTEDEGEIPDN